MKTETQVTQHAGKSLASRLRNSGQRVMKLQALNAELLGLLKDIKSRNGWLMSDATMRRIDATLAKAQTASNQP